MGLSVGQPIATTCSAGRASSMRDPRRSRRIWQFLSHACSILRDPGDLRGFGLHDWCS